jgi:hypothetical protein
MSYAESPDNLATATMREVENVIDGGKIFDVKIELKAAVEWEGSRPDVWSINWIRYEDLLKGAISANGQNRKFSASRGGCESAIPAGQMAYWRDDRRIVRCKRESDKSPFVMTLRVCRRH